MAGKSKPSITRDEVVRLWLRCQGLSSPRGELSFDSSTLTAHLETTGGLQVDSINVLDRAHYLTLWSRFGPYDRALLDHLVYQDRLAYEYWAHEASILPISHLPLSLRRMRRFPPGSWTTNSWWKHYDTPTASKRHVLRRVRQEGPLESANFERRAGEPTGKEIPGGTMPLPKQDKRSLKLLWHAGRLAIERRQHFRCIYDLAERVYPPVQPASSVAYEDSWLLTGLQGNGVASAAHLTNYLTAPELTAADRQRVIARNLKKKRVVEVQVEGSSQQYYCLPEHLDTLSDLPEARGTTLICPFDSLLWQRKRAEELLDFKYRVEIYVPAAKRQYGYYVLPIMHEGKLVGRLDPKLHRDRGVLEIRSIHLEPGFARDRGFDQGLAETLTSLGVFVGAQELQLPPGWQHPG